MDKKVEIIEYKELHPMETNAYIGKFHHYRLFSDGEPLFSGSEPLVSDREPLLASDWLWNLKSPLFYEKIWNKSWKKFNSRVA